MRAWTFHAAPTAPLIIHRVGCPAVRSFPTPRSTSAPPPGPPALPGWIRMARVVSAAAAAAPHSFSADASWLCRHRLAGSRSPRRRITVASPRPIVGGRVGSRRHVDAPGWATSWRRTTWRPSGWGRAGDGWETLSERDRDVSPLAASGFGFGSAPLPVDWVKVHPIGPNTIVLGVETSCDDTGAAVVTGDGRVLGEALASQVEIHAPWGGVVPNLAQEAHKDAIDGGAIWEWGGRMITAARAFFVGVSRPRRGLFHPARG